MKKVLVFLIFVFLVLLPLMVYTSETIELDIDAEYHDIRSDNNNLVHIVWLQKSQIWYGQLVNDQVINREMINYNASKINKRYYRPRLSIKPDGSEVHIAWVTPAKLPTKFIHCYRDLTDPDGKFKVETILSTSFNFQLPSVAADSDGVIHYLYQRYTASGDTFPPQIRYARRASINAKIEKLGMLVDQSIPHQWAVLSVDSKGGVHASWSVNKLKLQYCYAPSGGNLTESEIITLPTRHEKNVEPEVFIDIEDNVHIASLSYEPPGTDCHIDYFVKTPGASNFSIPTHASVTLFKVGFKYKPFPTVGAFSKDEVFVSWARATDLDLIPRVRLSRLIEGEWVKEPLDNNARIEREGRPTMATTSSYIYLIWRHQGGKLWLFKDTNCEILPPANASIKREESKSLFTSSYVDLITWEANPENEGVNIVNYRIYKKGTEGNELIAEVSPDTFSFGYGPIIENQTINYAIVAVRDDGIEGCEASPALELEEE